MTTGEKLVHDYTDHELPCEFASAIDAALAAVRLATLREAAGMECRGCRDGVPCNNGLGWMAHYDDPEVPGVTYPCECPEIAAAILSESEAGR